MQHICALLKIKLGFGSETFDKQPAKEEMSVRDCDGNMYALMQKINLNCKCF